MLRKIKPKNARSKRALAKKEPQTIENPKTALVLRSTSSSSLLNALLADINALKRPNCIRFTKKNDIHPFQDPSSLEFFSKRNDASLLVLASHSKKRPHNLTWIRCFDGRVLDMLELGIVPETVRTLQQFKGEKATMGVKPFLSFSGTQFESPTSNGYTLAKSIFIDFFRGVEANEVDVEGLQMLISFFAGEDPPDGQAMIQMRVWRILTQRSGDKMPRVEIEEMGPRIDFKVGRIREAETGMLKEAMKKAKGTEEKIKKNIETDLVGDKIGRIHLGKQDLSQLQTRKMKGLKRKRVLGEQEGQQENENISSSANIDRKRQKYG